VDDNLSLLCFSLLIDDELRDLNFTTIILKIRAIKLHENPFE